MSNKAPEFWYNKDEITSATTDIEWVTAWDPCSDIGVIRYRMHGKHFDGIWMTRHER